MSAHNSTPKVTVLWRGKLFGTAATSIYLIDTRPDSVYYEFKDIVPEVQCPLQLLNFHAVSEAGEFTILHHNSSVEILVDLLCDRLEQRYIAATLVAYNKELAYGLAKH